MGRPNVGKSSLLNAFVGSERVLAGPAAGLTRDSIHVHWNHAGRTFRLVDTAGWVSFSLFPSGWNLLGNPDVFRIFLVKFRTIFKKDGKSG